jgi:hypothetical protein
VIASTSSAARQPLTQVRASPCLAGLAHQCRVVVGGQDEHHGRRLGRQQQPCRRDPVQFRHPQVHQDHLGPQPQGQLHTLAAGAGLTHDHDLVVVQHRVELGAQARLVVDQQDAWAAGLHSSP